MASRHTDVLTAMLNVLAGEAEEAARRLPRALEVMKDAQGPLRGTDPSAGASGGTGGHSDPTAAQAGRPDRVRSDRRAIETHLRDMMQTMRQFTALVDRYNLPAAMQAELRGDSTVTNEDIWCDNHRAHGHQEPRGPQRRNCTWCDKVKSKYQRLPNARLIDAHARTPRLSESDYKRLLDMGAPP